MTKRRLIARVAIGIALLSTLAQANPPPRRIGVLMPQLTTSAVEEGLREGLSRLGYVEGENLIVEWRRFAGTPGELRSSAANLARANVDLIVAVGSQAAHAALAATALPVVFTLVGDPVATGFAASLANPGGHGTGVATLSTELVAKRLELLHQIVPRGERILYLMNSSSPIHTPQLEAAQRAAETLGLKLVPLDARNSGELDTALRAFPRSGADGLLIAGELLFLVHKVKVAEAIHKAKLPATVSTKENLGNGVLMAYGPNVRDMARRAAVYVDRILKGAKPADLPIEQVSEFELIIDLRVARALNLEVPQALLLRANEVIR
jgi:putative ABC transport system substrate-binding protein